MNRKDVEKKLEEQHNQIILYEKKIKDIVRAYKSLESEKNALQEVVSSYETGEDTGEATKQEDSDNSTEVDSKSLSSLRQAFVTLTKEKVKRETAFQNDKNALQTENDALKERLNKAADDTEEQAEKFARIVKELSQKVKRIEADRERELQDHGAVLAEMQQRYAKEKMSAENAHKQLVELYRKLQEKEDLPQVFRNKEKEFQDKITALQKEVFSWKDKADRTPTVQILQDQIENLKMEHARDIEEALKRGKKADASSLHRMNDLEDNIQRLTASVATSEREKFELMEQSRRQTSECRDLKERLEQLESRSANSTSAVADHTNTIENFKSLYSQLMSNGEDIYKFIEPDPKTVAAANKLEKLEDEYEKYKLKAEAVLRSKSNAIDSQEDTGLRSLVGQLHDKLRSLEVSHAADQAQYEQTTRNLRERISEFEHSEEISRNDMRKDMQHKISEMEAEMQKQRSRTLDVLAEKERELEVTKSILVSLRTEQLNTAPADPPQKSKRKTSEGKKIVDRRISSGSRKSMDAVSVSSLDYMMSDGNHMYLPNVNETRNVFYEDELAKREREVAEMRNNLHQMDYRMREMEQSTLCKDLQNHEMSEKLKEEIRILQGKLKLISSDNSGDIEYMRNIFIQYLNCSTTSGSKNILKAMGMVLKLSPKEMKTLERK